MERSSGIRVGTDELPIFKDDRIDGADVTSCRFNFVEKWYRGNLVRNGDAGAPKVSQGAEPFDRIADRFNLPSQIDKVQSEFLKCRVVNSRRERMLDRIADYAAKLRMSIDIHD